MATVNMCLFVCLFWWFHHTRELFTPMETIPISVRDGNFANAQYSWPLSSEGSMACNTYCDTGHPWNSYLLAVKLSLPVLTTWFCPACDTKTQHSAWETNVLTDSATAVAYTVEMNMIATKKTRNISMFEMKKYLILKQWNKICHDKKHHKTANIAQLGNILPNTELTMVNYFCPAFVVWQWCKGLLLHSRGAKT